MRGLEIYQHAGRNALPKSLVVSIFEGSLICCRWSASFLGLQFNETSLGAIKNPPKSNDVFSIDLGGTLLDATVALNEEERKLLQRTLHTANVGTAHPVRERPDLETADETIQHVSQTALILVREIKVHLYDALNLRFPR
jgi:hypothetical protein